MDSDVELIRGDTWPRFLTVESVDKANPLSKLSLFAIAKVIKGIAGEPREIRMTIGGLLIDVARKAHVMNMLKQQYFPMSQ